jgi:hypothetical protein
LVLQQRYPVLAATQDDSSTQIDFISLSIRQMLAIPPLFQSAIDISAARPIGRTMSALDRPGGRGEIGFPDGV